MRYLTSPITTLTLLLASLLFAAPAFADITATPADYGYPTPIPEPLLPAGIDTYTPPLIGIAGALPVGEWTRTGAPNDTITLAGPDFSTGTLFRSYGQTTASNAVQFDRAPNAADAFGATVTLPNALPAWSMYLLWPHNGDQFARPVAINRTDAWWIGFDQAAPGDTVSVYGRNLSKNNGTQTSYIYIKPVDQAGQWVTPTSVNPYRVSFVVPQLAPGTYEVWTHNGHGGRFGWSGPLTLTILANDPFNDGRDAKIFNVKNYGAVGDGVTDDTAAIKAAQSAAYTARPATLYFPAGTYLMNRALGGAREVTFLGDSRDTSIIKVGPGFTSSTNPDPNAGFVGGGSFHIINEYKNLTFDGNGNLASYPLFWYEHGDQLRITNVRFIIGPSSPSTIDISDSHHVRISNVDVTGSGVWVGSATQVAIDGMNLKLTNYTTCAFCTWGGSEISIRNVTAQDLDPTASSAAGVGTGRFFVSQGHWGTVRHVYIADNQTINMAPPLNIPGLDVNQGEQILFEQAITPIVHSVLSATSNTVTFDTTSGISTQHELTIVSGRGTGQVRQITAISGNTVTVSPAWECKRHLQLSQRLRRDEYVLE